jgi:hypothetical protein
MPGSGKLALDSMDRVWSQLMNCESGAMGRYFGIAFVYLFS